MRKERSIVLDLILSQESLPAVIRLAVALVVIVGGGKASCDYLLPKADLNWYVDRSQPGSGLDPEMSLIAVNTGNAVAILPRTGILHYGETCMTVDLNARESGDRSLDPNESVRVSLGGTGRLRFGPTTSELHYKARYPPSGELVSESYKFRCEGLLIESGGP